MGRAWSNKAEYSHLSGELASATSRDFEKAVLPLLRVVWHDVIGPPALGHYDRMGVDHMVWSDDPPHPLVVQHKGFQVEQIGPDQTRQCLKSIRDFAESGRQTRVYLLVHNRENRDPSFRAKIKEALDALVTEGVAERAEMWDRQRLLKEAFDGMLRLVNETIAQGSLSTSAPILSEAGGEELIVRRVPIRSSELLIDQYRLRESSAGDSRFADPATEIVRKDDSSVSIVIGEFGLGKTTGAVRAAQSHKGQLFYVPAAAISRDTKSSKDLLEQCVDLGSLLSRFPAQSSDQLRKLARPAIEAVFKHGPSELSLVIDGLDEMSYIDNRGGLQWLMNSLRDVRIPLVLVTRTEYWRSRVADFSTSLGLLTKKGQYRYQKMRLIEFLPWRDAEILDLARRYRDSRNDDQQRARLDQLVNLIKKGSYQEYYGDIPRRPLFLRCILESVEQVGIAKKGRARLVEEWARLKVLRDITRPVAAGGEGRIPIARNADGADVTLDLAWKAMKAAAATMVELQDDRIELLPTADLESIKLRVPSLGGMTDPAGLMLNSLLVPASGREPDSELRVRFAHRAFQEFFLALHILAEPANYEDRALPKAVSSWIEDIKGEN